MKISIVGWYGMKNVGDEAFRSVLPLFFSGHDIEFVTPPHTCNDPDIVVLGGGAVVSPFYIDTLPECTRYALGVDLAYKSEVIHIAKGKFSGVFIRNAADVDELRKMIDCPIKVIPDLAFLLKPSGDTSVYDRYKQTDKPCVGIFATDYVNPAIDRDVEQFSARSWSFQTKMAAELDKLQKAGYEVMLVPCATGGYGDDRRMNLGIAAFMETRPTNIMDTLSPQEVIDLTACLDTAICMRFHAHVFSIIAGTKFLSLDYTRKVELLLKENIFTDVSVGRFESNSVFVVDSLVDRVKNNSIDPSRLLEISNRHHTTLEDAVKQVRQEWLR